MPDPVEEAGTVAAPFDFDLPEAEIFDQGGRMISILAAERNIADRIIEEFMRPGK